MFGAKLALLVWLLVAFVGAGAPGVANCQAPSTWNGQRCTCSIGMVLCNGKCICDYGYWPVASSCIKCNAQYSYNGKSCAGSSSNVPTGYSWNGKFIVQDWTVNNCGAQKFWNGLYCDQLAYPLSCKPGYNWNGNVCVRFDHGNCPAGQYWNGAAFVPFVNPPVCQKNYIWNSHARGCIHQVAVVPCPSNKYYFNGTFCVGVGSTKCSHGYYFNGNTCAVYGTTNVPICSSGMYWNGQLCAGGSPSCLAGYYFEQPLNCCVVKQCNGGMNFDSVGKKCSSTAPPAPAAITAVVVTAPASSSSNVSISAGASALTPVVVSTTTTTPTSTSTAAITTTAPAITTPPTATATTVVTTATPVTTSTSTATVGTSTPNSTSTLSTKTTTVPLNSGPTITSPDGSSITAGTTTVVGNAVISQGGSAVSNGGGLVVAPGATAVGTVYPPLQPIQTSLTNTLDPTTVQNQNGIQSIAGIIQGANNNLNLLNNTQGASNGVVKLTGPLSNTVIQSPSINSAGSSLSSVFGNKTQSTFISNTVNGTALNSLNQGASLFSSKSGRQGMFGRNTTMPIVPSITTNTTTTVP